jgi:hypothetical protein
VHPTDIRGGELATYTVLRQFSTLSHTPTQTVGNDIPVSRDKLKANPASVVLAGKYWTRRFHMLNNADSISGISKFFSMGVAFLQHKKFVASIAGVPDPQRFKLLQSYVDGWPESSFVGFSLTLAILVQQEKDPLRKQAIEFLSGYLDSVRAETDVVPGSEQSVEPDFKPQLEQAPFLQNDVDFLNDLVFNNPKDEHANILVDRLASFNSARYDQFKKNLHTIQIATAEAYQNHRKNELSFGRHCFEDRFSYFMARERTGQKDPNFVRVCSEYERSLAACAWAIEVAPRIWNSLGRQ